MSKRQILILLGVWVMIILRLGFPLEWTKTILLVTGALIIVVAYRVKPETKPRKDGGLENSYIDNQPTIGKI